MEALKINFSF